MAEHAHTFLFIDLVGFTALAELEGDGRALEVVLELQGRVRGLLGDYGAEEVKAIGDGLMLHSTNASAAIRLAARLVDEPGTQPGFPLVRVGVHTGPALPSEGDWYGRTVNVAARLCSVAPGGEVLVSAAARERAGRVAELVYGERELHWLRNLSEPIAAYLVTPRRGSDQAAAGASAAVSTPARDEPMVMSEPPALRIPLRGWEHRAAIQGASA